MWYIFEKIELFVYAYPPPFLIDINIFNRDGFLVVKGFFDLETHIKPITNDIQSIIEIVCTKYGVCIPNPDLFYSGYLELKEVNRNYASEVYDAVKQLGSFMQLLSSEHILNTIKQLMPQESLVAIARNGFGIRIDDPYDIKFKTNYHQDYSGQLRSPRGIALWSPLVDITPDIGPVIFAKGSHLSGVFPILTVDKIHPDIKVNADAYNFANENKLLSAYERVAPLLDVGDAIFIDFLNAHCSGQNKSNHSRWCMQLRYFNMKEPVGISHSWSGGVASNVDFQKIHPKMHVNSADNEQNCFPIPIKDLIV